MEQRVLPVLFYPGGPESVFWNMFDQVLIRPSLLDQFAGVRILTKVGVQSLSNKSGRPDKSLGSDHYPIIFSLKI